MHNKAPSEKDVSDPNENHRLSWLVEQQQDFPYDRPNVINLEEIPQSMRWIVLGALKQSEAFTPEMEAATERWRAYIAAKLAEANGRAGDKS